MFKFTKKTMALVAVCALAMVSALAQTSNSASDFKYDLASDNESVIITKYKGNDKHVVIPSEIEGFPVSTLGESCFYRNETLESVVIPSSISAIGYSCFSGCKSLKTFVWPKNIKDIPDGCFSHCYSLENIVLPDGLKSIGKYAFYECNALRKINIPDSVESIGGSAFSNSGLTEIKLPNSIQKIPACLFENCRSLVSVVYGNNITEIDDGAFCECTALEKFNIRSSIRRIGGAAFVFSSLKELEIDNEIAKIDFTSSDYIDYRPYRTFGGTNLNLATKAKLRKLGYEGEFN